MINFKFKNNKIKNKKYAKKLALCFIMMGGIVLYNNEPKTIDKKSVIEMTQEEKLETRGILNIQFKNKEYLQKKDGVILFDDNENGYGVIYSTHDDYSITLEPKKYNFHLKYFDIIDSFIINDVKDIITIVIDYQNNEYKILKKIGEENIIVSENNIGKSR